MKTAMQELKDKIQHAIEQLNDELNEYKAGYKQCLINIQNDIDSQMLEMEKEQITYCYDFVSSKICTQCDDFKTGDEYYNQTYKSEQ